MKTVKSKPACYIPRKSLFLQDKGAQCVPDIKRCLYTHVYNTHICTTPQEDISNSFYYRFTTPSNWIFTVPPQPSPRMENPAAEPQKCYPKYPDTSLNLSNGVIQSHSALQYPYLSFPSPSSPKVPNTKSGSFYCKCALGNLLNLALSILHLHNLNKELQCLNSALLKT